MVKLRRMLATTSELYEWLREKYRESEQAMRVAVRNGWDPTTERGISTAYLCVLGFAFGTEAATEVVKEEVEDARKEAEKAAEREAAEEELMQ
jgi:hypothetical protein